MQHIYATAQEMAATIIASFSWAKVIYSAILLGLIGIAFAELGRLWLDTRTYVGAFTFYEKGEEKAPEGKTFSLQVMNQHKLLLQLFSTEEARRKAAVDPNKTEPVAARTLATQENTWWPREVSPIHNPKSLLSEIELSVQGINVRDILTKFRQWISAPREISGTVQKSDGGVSASMSWTHGTGAGGLVLVDPQPDAWKAALHVACSVIWAEEQQRNPQLAAVPRADFCGWADAWVSFVTFRDKVRMIAGLTDTDVEQLKSLRNFTSRLISGGAGYPEIFRLRADIVDLIPADKKTNDDLAQAQGDRNKYALLTNPTANAFAVLAAARPAIAVKNGDLTGPISETWRGSLTPFGENVRVALRATGVGRFQKKGTTAFAYSFSGFAVAPGLIATVGYGLLDWQTPDGKYPFALSDDFDAEFSFDETAPQAGKPLSNALRISEVVYRGQVGTRDHLALVRLVGHDDKQHPPLTIERANERLSAVARRYVFVVGYPAKDSRLPEEFLEHLLGNEPSSKRVMPGRVISIDPGEESGPRVIKSDVSTTGGTGGGPLIDLETGRVIGLHYAGVWGGESGKFSWADSLADLMAGEQFPTALKEEIFGDSKVDGLEAVIRQAITPNSAR